MRLGRDEVVALLTTWRDDAVAVRCDFEGRRFSTSFRGRIFAVEARDVRLISDDGVTELTLRLADDLTFEYTDPRAFPTEAIEAERALVIFFPPIADDGSQDFMALTELKDSE